VHNSVKHTFFLLLMIIIGGAVLHQHSGIESSRSGIFATDYNTPCQQLSQSSIEAAEVANPNFENSSESNTTDTQPKSFTSCNSLVNVLPAESDFSFNLAETEMDLAIYNALLSSQTFVFQEPDPPRFG
jgi:hypothetical protein